MRRYRAHYDVIVMLDDVMAWKHFSKCLFVREIPRSSVDSRHTEPVTRALMVLCRQPEHAVQQRIVLLVI